MPWSTMNVCDYTDRGVPCDVTTLSSGASKGVMESITTKREVGSGELDG